MDTNPNIVAQKANEMGIGPIYLSTRKAKKYMVYNGGKWVHFGQKGYEDFTLHGDEKRRDNFRRRNRKWAMAEPMTPAFLSYYLLW